MGKVGKLSVKQRHSLSINVVRRREKIFERNKKTYKLILI